MPELDLQNATTMAKRMRKAVEKKTFPLKNNQRKGNITISLGMAAIKSGEELSPEKFII